MNYLKNIIAVLALALGLLFPSAAVLAAEESPVDVFMYVVRGPIRTNNVVDPRYDAWSHALAKELYDNMTLTNKDVGYRLLPEYILQSSAAGSQNNETLHYAVRAVGKKGSKVSLNMFRFTQRSSDPGNTLSNSYSFGDVPNLLYTPRAIGVTYGPGGNRATSERDTQGNGDLLKDEIVVVGLQGRFYWYSNQTRHDQTVNYITNFPNYELTGTCEIAGHANAVSQRTLQVRGEPLQPTLSIAKQGDMLNLGISAEGGRTVILYSRPNPLFGEWTIQTTLNPGDVILRPKDGGMGYFKAILQ